MDTNNERKNAYQYVDMEDTAATGFEENFRVISPGRMVAKRFFKSKLSIAGLAMVLFVFVFSFVGPWIIDLTWKYKETQVFKIERNSDMVSSADFKGPDGKPYQYYDKSRTVVLFKAPLSKDHWLGTDTSGFDILTRLMYGGRISLVISFIVIIMETILGIILGGLAGYFGKWVDQVVMRIVDIFACLPGLPILLILSATISSIESIPAEHRIYYLMAFLTLMGWTGVARLVRGQILMLREQEYMMAAETTGISAFKKIFKHLVPNAMPQLIVSATLGLGGVILYESTLSYLGLGVPFPRAAWGSMIALADPSKGQEILANYPNMWVPAGILIVIAVLGFSFMGDGLRDAFDPRMKR
ncbi:MAG TPA: ABC transporter permease [Bacillota bacterium]|jgi:peptide/nickel transport system permease protein|nr:ABC transporter permease [Fastidiosipila sp.]HPX93333.1 ABC transporter permease [Bacillota bacterium]HQB80530.1 ABC transporter permease [Bacillota bacterium]